MLMIMRIRLPPAQHHWLICIDSARRQRLVNSSLPSTVSFLLVLTLCCNSGLIRQKVQEAMRQLQEDEKRAKEARDIEVGLSLLFRFVVPDCA
jgi:hypothetical protein